MIYFIRAHNKFVKIGTSIQVENRKNDLQTASPLKLHIKAVLEGSYKTEKGLHELFEKHKVRGEWFRYTDEIKWFIRAVQENPSVNNINTLYQLSQQMRIKSKSKRMSKKGNNKLSNRIESFCGA